MNKKASLALTVFNETKSIGILLNSILSQTRLPDEIIIVDGGSTDDTVKKIKDCKEKNSYFKKKLELIVKPGENRPSGRNISIDNARNEIVAITDSGCELDKKWFEKITAPFSDYSIDLVSGYYKAASSSVFEKCLAPYVLVMPDRLNPKDFLPSARSMAFKKSVWKRAGGFPQEYPLNEDYVFNLRLKKLGKKFYFVKDAIVYWLPRENIKKSFLMFYYFAKGDAQAKIIRPKVILIFARYTLGFFLLFLFLFSGSLFYLRIIFYILALYIIWSVSKNYYYVKKWQAIFLLPLIQFTADFAVLTGTTLGLFKNLWDTLRKP